MSAISSKRLAKLTIDTTAGIRNEESFNVMYDVAVKDSKNIPFVGEPVLKRKLKTPKYSVLNFVEGYSSTSPTHQPASPSNQYREQAIDVIVSSVNDRFDQPSFIVFEKLEFLLIYQSSKRRRTVHRNRLR